MKIIEMRTLYKIFSMMLVFVLLTSFLFNWNKIDGEYFIFSQSIGERLFGLSYTVPLNVFGFIMLYQAKFFWEKLICRLFLWFSLSAFSDELFFDPFTPQLWEHLTGLFILIITYYYEQITRDRH